MAKYQIQGLEEYAMQLSKLKDASDGVAKMAVYDGAKVVADEIKKNIEALPVDNGFKAKGKIKGVTKIEKDGLIESFGISDMQEQNGYIYVKLGFDGYNKLKTHKYKKGQPNQLIARSVESGSSIREKHPFIRVAINITKSKAEAEMGKTIDKAISKLF